MKTTSEVLATEKAEALFKTSSSSKGRRAGLSEDRAELGGKRAAECKKTEVAGRTIDRMSSMMRSRGTLHQRYQQESQMKLG